MEETRLKRINELTTRYAQGIITPKERLELEIWLNEHPINRERFEVRIKEDDALESLAFQEEGARRAPIVRERLREFLDPTPVIQPYKRIRIIWYAASAAVLLFLVTGIWLVTKNRQKVPTSVASNQSPILAPGSNRAILQLSDGSRIDLAAATKGTVLAKEGNAQITKQDSGQLSYTNLTGKAAAVLYNSIITPRGGTYRVVLPDGTVAWLNAESSLHFPTNFNGAQREVEMTGEVYFEVAQNKAAPFIVHAGEMNIKVLGTHFDVQTYTDEKSKQATLLEGSVSVQAAGTSVVLHPGEQASLTDKITVDQVDTGEAIAWKDGFFMFKHADIATVMQQISRWYNVKVVYEGQKTDRHLTGRVSRQSNADDVLEILEANGYHISIAPDTKTITILP
jgi:ferric-dicitrate binding protein FerR (iron transport regulator)